MKKKQVDESTIPKVKPMKFVDQYPETPGCAAHADCVFGRFSVFHETWEFYHHGSNTLVESNKCENFRLAAVDAQRRYAEMVLQLLEVQS